MELKIPHGKLRPFRKGDEEQLVKIANNYNIWKNLRDEFPHPYTLETAENWISYCMQTPEVPRFAIEIDGLVQGGTGFKELEGKNYEHAFEIGYWLAEDYWEKGITNGVLPVVLDYAFNTLGKKRIVGVTFEYNPKSAHVLRKAGFVEEGRARSAVKKEGKYYDELHFGLLAEEFNGKK